jgi:hypothetical protein
MARRIDRPAPDHLRRRLVNMEFGATGIALGALVALGRLGMGWATLEMLAGGGRRGYRVYRVVRRDRLLPGNGHRSNLPRRNRVEEREYESIESV